MIKQVKRGEIYYADLSPVVGSEQSGIRPVLIIQNDRDNNSSPSMAWTQHNNHYCRHVCTSRYVEQGGERRKNQRLTCITRNIKTMFSEAGYKNENYKR